MASSWKGVIRWDVFSTEIFINLDLFGETVILASKYFEKHTQSKQVLFKFLVWYLVWYYQNIAQMVSLSHGT